jgi:hypothetical protein
VIWSEGQSASSVLYIPRLNEAAANLEPESARICLRKVSAPSVAGAPGSALAWGHHLRCCPSRSPSRVSRLVSSLARALGGR